MNLENVKCFVSLAEYLSFTKAAEKERVTQSTMSRKISSLENELGVSLVYRDSHQVELTDAGREFYYQAVKLLELYQQTVSSVQNINSGFMRELKIGVGIYEHQLLSSFLDIYVSENPQVRISCMQFRYLPLIKQFEQNLLDIIITSDQFFHEISLDNVAISLVHDSDWRLGVHRENPLSAYDAIPSKFMRDQTLITMNEGSNTQLINDYRHAFTVKDFINVNSYETKAMMVNANLGVGLFPKFVTLESYANVCMKELQVPYKLRRFYILCRKDNPSRFVHQFMNRYCEHIQTANPPKEQ